MQMRTDVSYVNSKRNKEPHQKFEDLSLVSVQRKFNSELSWNPFQFGVTRKIPSVQRTMQHRYFEKPIQKNILAGNLGITCKSDYFLHWSFEVGWLQ